MARTSKKQNEELLQQAYNFAAAKLNFTDDMSVNERAKALVMAADDVQSDICRLADSIAIDAYAEVKEHYPELGIPKNVWLELVHIRRLQRHTQLSDDYIAKIAATFEGAKNVTALRSAMLKAIQENNLDNAAIPTCETEKQLSFEANEKLSEEFIVLLNTCADTRHEIDSQLWPRLRAFGDAFCYLTKEPYKVFKQLLDFWHYRNGGWPKATTPPRIWNVIFHFINSLDTLDRYGFTMGQDWCRRMGLKVERTLPSPTMHMFGDAMAENFSKYFMFKVKEEAIPNYPKYAFKPWLHCIANDNKFFAYVWDTREIMFMGDIDDIDINDVTTDYSDNCYPLQTNECEVTVKLVADELIPLCFVDAIEVQGSPNSEPGKRSTQTYNLPDKIEPKDFAAEVAKRKAEFKKNFPDTPELREIFATDVLEQYEYLITHPEIGFDTRDVNAKWHDGDKIYNDVLGAGEIVGADLEAGQLICLFYHYNMEFRMWPWHLSNRSTAYEAAQKAEQERIDAEIAKNSQEAKNQEAKNSQEANN